VFVVSAHSQYYLRGEVRDEKHNLLSNARILLHSTGYVYSSGSSGSFGIMTKQQVDSITISLDGYQALSIKLETARYHSLILKTLVTSANLQKNRLLSFTRNLKPDERRNWLVQKPIIPCLKMILYRPTNIPKQGLPSIQIKHRTVMCVVFLI
jgi:Ca-activated chloride channel family protein